MKLHLPKGLKNAVLACMTVVGGFATTVGAGFVAGGAVAIAFMAAHVQAATYEITTNSDDNLTLATAKDQIILDLTGWLTWNGTLAINAPVEIVKGEFIDGSSNRTYTFKNTITGSGDFSYCPPSRSSANNLTYVFEGDMSAYSGNMSVVAGKKGTFTFRGTTGTGSVTALNAESVVNIEGATVNNSSINAATINISGAANLKSGISLNASRAINNSATITLDSVTLGHSITNTGSITLSGEVNLLDSLGTMISATTENGFVQKRYEIASGSGTLTLAEGVKLMVHGTDYAASYVAGEEVILTSSQYCVAESGSTVDSTTVEGETGYLVVGNNAVLKLTDLRDSLTGSLSEGVTVDVGNDNSATVEVSGAGVTFNDNNITRTSGTLNVTVGDGSTLELTQHASSPNINGDLTIKAGGVVNATTGDVFGWGGNSTKNVILLGEESKLATLNLSNGVELSTNFVLSGNAQILSTSADATAPASLDTYGGKITATGTNNTIGVAIRALKALTIEVTGKDDTLDITGCVYRHTSTTSTAGAGSITKTGAGTLTLSYSSEDNTNEINGLVNVEAGTLKFAGDTRLGAGVKVAAGASLVNEGTITLTSLSLLNILGIDAYLDATGAVSENGYRAGRYTVIEAQAGATITGVNSVMLDGETLATAVDNSSGSIYVAGVDKSTYWVNTQVAYDAETMTEVGSFTVAAGATLTTTDATMFNKVTLADATSSLYFTNREGMRVLEFTDYSTSSVPLICGGNVFFCSADADSPVAMYFKDSALGEVKSLTFDTLSNLTFSTSSISRWHYYITSLTITNVNDGQSGTVDVLFEDMKSSSSSSYCEGGAIYRTKVIISNNGDVTFRGNSAEAYTSFTAYSSGGAIYVSGGLTISNNNDVTFCGNSAYSSDTDSVPIAYSKGGAIYASGSLTISNNNNVIFSRNSANSYTPVNANSCSTDGGAICAAGDLTISNNTNVIFNGNSVYVSSNWLHSNGGAISASGDLTISNNNNVIFSGNSAAYSLSISDDDDIYAESFGGAIYVCNSYDDVSLHIQGNDSVLFEKNYINSNGSYRLESIYIPSHHGSVNMSLSAKTGGNITFYDSAYTDGDVYLNSDYTDTEGNTQNAKGDIIFSGKYTEQHLNEILAANNENRTATAEEILNSLTSKIQGKTYLYDGRLRIEDGAIYIGQGLTVSSSTSGLSNPTVLLKNGEMNHDGYSITLNAGTRLELSGINTICADNMQLNNSAGFVFNVDSTHLTTAALSYTGALTLGGELVICINSKEGLINGNTYKLMTVTGTSTTGAISWGSTNITIQAGDGLEVVSDDLIWQDNVLYLNYSGTTTVDLTWLGGKKAVWQTDNETLWMNALGDKVVYRDGDWVTFTQDTIEIVGEVQPGSITLAPVKSLTFKTKYNKKAGEWSGSIGGEGISVTIAGGAKGKVTMNDGNTYTGITSIESGTVNVGGSTSFGKSSIVISGGSLDLKSKAVANEIELTGSATIKGGKKYLGTYSQTGGELMKGSELNVAESATLTGGVVNGTLSGEGTVTVDGDVELGTTGKITTDKLLVDGTLSVSNKGLAMNTKTSSITVEAGGQLISEGALKSAALTVDGGLLELHSAKASSIAITNNMSMRNGADVTAFANVKAANLLMTGAQLTLGQPESDIRRAASSVALSLTAKGNVVLSSSALTLSGKISTGNLFVTDSYVNMTSAKLQTIAVKDTLMLSGDNSFIFDFDAKDGKSYKLFTFKYFMSDGTALHELLGWEANDSYTLTANAKNITLKVKDAEAWEAYMDTLASGEAVETLLEDDELVESAGVAAASFMLARPAAAVDPMLGKVADTLVQSTWGTAGASRAFGDTIAARGTHATALANGKGSAWVSTMGGSSRISSDGGRAGADYTLTGAAFGMEARLSEKSTVGLAIGNSWGKVSTFSAFPVDADSTHQGIYGKHILGSSTTLSWMAAHTRTESDANLAGMACDWTQDALQLDARVDKLFAISDRTTVSAFVGMQYLATDKGECNGLSSGSLQNLRGEIGVSAAHKATDKAYIYGELSFIGDMVRHNPTATVGDYRSRGANPGRAGLNLSVGASYQLNDSWSLNGSYNLELMQNQTSHSANVGATYSF